MSSEQLAQSLSFQYHAEDGTWNVDYIHGLGMYALKDGYLIRLSDAEGQVIWDAENHDMTLCHQIMPRISVPRCPSVGRIWMGILQPIVMI